MMVQGGGDGHEPAGGGPPDDGRARVQPNTLGPERILEVVAVLALAALSVSALLLLAGPGGLRLVGGDDDPVAEFTVQLNYPIASLAEHAAELRSVHVEDAQLIEPLNSSIAIDVAPGSQRAMWLAWQVLGRVLGIAGVWMVYRLVRSTRNGSPFTRANVNRLGGLAGLAAIGGSLYPLAGDFIRTWMVDESDAGGLVTTTFEIDLLPVVVAGLLAVLATVWSLGVELDGEVSGMV